MARNHCFAGVHKSFHAIQGFVSKLKNLIQRVRRSSVSVFDMFCSTYKLYRKMQNFQSFA